MNFTNEFYVGWGTLALINANIAQTKGRRGLSWFLVSLIVGPIATFMLLFIEPMALDPGVEPFDIQNFRKQ